MLKNNEIKDIVKVIRFLKNGGFFFLVPSKNIKMLAKDIKILQKKKKQNMAMSNIRIFLKMKNKGYLSIEKITI